MDINRLFSIDIMKHEAIGNTGMLNYSITMISIYFDIQLFSMLLQST